MNYIDILIVVIILFSIWAGWHRGFILGFLDLLRWVLSLLIGLRYYPDVANWLSKFVDWNQLWLLPVAFLLAAMLTSMLFQFVANLALKKLPYGIHNHRANHALGILPGLLSGVITAAIITILLLAIPLPDGFGNSVQESRLINRFGLYAGRLEEKLAPAIDKATQRTINKLTVEPNSKEFVELPFKVTHFEPQPDLEEKMLELINEERAEEGLPPLKPDTALTSVARQHSADMFSRGYFSHYSPEGSNAFDRMKEASVRFRAAGENLAMAPTLTIAHRGLMNSPGHRKNILQKRFGRVGIGVQQGSPGRLMITQVFRN